MLRLQDHIETGLCMNKPLAQFFGLETLREETRIHTKGISGVMVCLPGGETVAQSGPPIAQAEALCRASRAGRRKSCPCVPRLSGTRLQSSDKQALFATRLQGAEARTQGALLLQMETDT
jgi:hypothetical protein